MKTITEQNYLFSVITLIYCLACKGQTKPNGKSCAICEDNGHQAFECEHNAFNLFWKLKSGEKPHGKDHKSPNRKTM